MHVAWGRVGVRTGSREERELVHLIQGVANRPAWLEPGLGEVPQKGSESESGMRKGPKGF